MVEVGLPLLRVEASNIGIADKEDALPRLVYCGKVLVLDVENIIDELKALVKISQRDQRSTVIFAP